MIDVRVQEIEGFSMGLYEVVIGEEVFYPLQTLYPIFGYHSVSGLKSILHPFKDHLYIMDDVYRVYVLDRIDAGEDYLNIDGFVQTLRDFHTVPPQWLMHSKSYFTDQDGITYILSRNTFTTDRVKKAVLSSLNLQDRVVCPERLETHFYDRLSSILKEWGFSILRQYSYKSYRLDMVVVDSLNQFICALEFDEKAHTWYDREHEEERSLALKGVPLIRVPETETPEHIAYQIIHFYKESSNDY